MGEGRDESTRPEFNSQYPHGGSLKSQGIRRPLLVTTGIAHLWHTYM